MDNELACEVDFLPVGKGERSGDAITLRYGQLNSIFSFTQKVIVIDGGTLESGQKLVEHIQNVYRTNTVDLIISTHSDNDHCSGLREVLDTLTVKEIWLHTPWNSVRDYLDLFKDGRITLNGLEETLREELNVVHELEQIAIKKGIRVREPYTGLSYDNGIIRILGPSESYYNDLLPHFRSTPEALAESAISKAIAGVKEAINWLAESMYIETLDESGETSAENNSSAITLFSFDNFKALFTSDTGIPALKNAIQYAKDNFISLKDLTLLQVPHHGSKRNVSPSVLNEIKSLFAYISCAPDGAPKHPSKKVTNALKRREMKPYSTKENILSYRHKTPRRDGYTTAIEIPFYTEVEE